MKSALNPFTPGAGLQPEYLAGREKILERYEVLFDRFKLGKVARPIYLYGLRGVGKTVMLNRIEDIAQARGVLVERFEVDEKTEYDFRQVVFNTLKAMLLSLDTTENLKGKFMKVLQIMKSISVNYQGVELKLDVEEALGQADSKNFQEDLQLLARQIGEVAKAKRKIVCLLIDELQYLDKTDLAALLGAQHRMGQDGLPVIFLGAGLPSLLSESAEAKTYAERFDFVELGPLDKEAAELAISEPLRQEKVSIEPMALARLIEKTGRYPYFIQQFGEQTWNTAKGPTITLEDVQEAEPTAIAALDSSFFRVRYDRSTDEERKFMLCMAHHGAGAVDINKIKACLGKSDQHVGQYRSRLIRKGFIYGVGHGKVDFTVPLFGDFILRKG